jgi:hypothetical protein
MAIHLGEDEQSTYCIGNLLVLPRMNRPLVALYLTPLSLTWLWQNLLMAYTEMAG